MKPETIIERIREGLESRNQMITHLYKDPALYKRVAGTLVNMGCPKDQINDFFTDAIVNFVKACYQPSFSIKSSMANYITGIAKNLWLKEVTKKVVDRTTLDKVESEFDNSIEIVLIKRERTIILKKLINQLDEACRKVLNLWAMKEKMQVIAQKMSYKSEGMARKKKHQCLKKLIAVIDSYPSILNELSSL